MRGRRVIALLLAACSPTPPLPAPHAPPPEPPSARDGRLLVYIVVDQGGQELFDAQRDAYTGGLRRLLDQGFVANARHAHAITFTCPGHATLSTGVSPDQHGIVGNDWWFGGQEVYCADPAYLRAPTLAEQVQAGGGKVAALSLKDRGATMMGGPRPDLVGWWDKGARGWSLTPSQGWSPPTAAWEARPWEAADPVAYGARFPDDQPWEGEASGLGRTFPHPPPADLKPGAFLTTPMAGSALTELAVATLMNTDLGRHGTADLLTISFSQVDYIGHAYTARSWEALDAMRVLDRDLDALFRALDELRPGRWAAILTADHGGAPPAELRFTRDEVVAACDGALAALGEPTGCHEVDPGVWLPDAVRADPARRERASRAAAAAITALRGVDAYAWWLPDAFPAGFPYAESVRRSVDAERSGDLYLMYEPFAVPRYNDAATGTSHGTPYDYDARVPFLAVGSGVARSAHRAEVDTRDIPATAAAWLGVRLPEGAGKPVEDALAAR